jgi:hypothetical protein
MARRFLLDTHVVIDIGAIGGFEAMPLRVQRLLKDPDVDLFAQRDLGSGSGD